jgi:uncharacterized protein (DUF1810 family)
MENNLDLGRFVYAQDPIYPSVLAELRQGEKVSHWMWYIFPQIAGLGHSSMARRYAIEDEQEASAYLHHSILGERLKVCTSLVNEVKGRSARAIFGSIDEMKFRSCMILFDYVARDSGLFDVALSKYFDGKRDRVTIGKLDQAR